MRARSGVRRNCERMLTRPNATWNFGGAADGTSGAARREGRLREVPDLWQLSDKPALMSDCRWGVVRHAQGGIENLD